MGGRKSINAKCETVHALPTFRHAYWRRRCIVPVDGFFEWKAIKGQKAQQPYAIAMKDGSPFSIGGRALITTAALIAALVIGVKLPKERYCWRRKIATSWIG